MKRFVKDRRCKAVRDVAQQTIRQAHSSLVFKTILFVLHRIKDVVRGFNFTQSRVDRQVDSFEAGVDRSVKESGPECESVEERGI
jgi:hypothetical protein